MRVLISGRSGFLGSALAGVLSAERHEAVGLGRGEIDAAGLEGADAVVHLAGENVFGRWTEAKKERIRGSRVLGTERLARALAGLGRKPRVLVCGSAIGFYGDGGDAVLDEESARGDGFLAEVVEAWERAAQPAVDAGIRTVWVRTGVVLGPEGGALAKMLTPFRLGVGGRVGSGKQWTSWIAREDWVRAVRHLIDVDFAGVVNVVAPNPVTNRELTAALAEALRRPAVLPVPSIALEALFGSEATREMFLVSQRVSAARLLSTGFRFEHPELGGALRAMLA